MELKVISETASTITLGWSPLPNVACYAFFAAGRKVSMADALNKDGTPRLSVKFSKTSPGPPFAVVAVVKSGDWFAVDWGAYPPPTSGALYPPQTTSVGLYPH